MRLLTYAEMLARPPQVYLIDGLIPEGSLVMLYGPSGVGKSFVALDMAHSIASGRPWLGHKVRQGPGLYVIAEGLGGFPKRLSAWCEAKGLGEPGPMRYIGEPVRLHDPKEVKELISVLEQAEHRPSIIVVDTLHASLAGGNENDPSEMSVLVAGCKALIAAFGCTVGLVHHTGWDTSRERGSSSLRADMEVRIALRPIGGGNVEFKPEKSRDGLVPPPFTIRLRPVGDAMVPDLVTDHVGELTVHQRAVLAALADGEAHTDKSWRERSGLTPATYYRVKSQLLDANDAIEHDGKRFRLTDHGRELLSANAEGAYSHSQLTIREQKDSGITSLSLTPLSKGVRVIGNAGSENERANGDGIPLSPAEEAAAIAAYEARQNGAASDAA